MMMPMILLILIVPLFTIATITRTECQGAGIARAEAAQWALLVATGFVCGVNFTQTFQLIP